MKSQLPKAGTPTPTPAPKRSEPAKPADKGGAKKVVKRLLALGVVWLGLAAATPLPLTAAAARSRRRWCRSSRRRSTSRAARRRAAAARADRAAAAAAGRARGAGRARSRSAADAAAAHAAVHRRLDRRGLGVARVRARALPAGRVRRRRQGARERRSPGAEREILREARYWLGETYYRLGRIEQADWLFRQVAQERCARIGDVWALHSQRLDGAARSATPRARATPSPRCSAAPVPLADRGSGRATASGSRSYALGRHEDAEQAWALVLAARAPPVAAGARRPLLARRGARAHRRAARAAAELKRFVDGGPHPLLPTAQLRLAWWTLAAGRAPEARARRSARYLAHAAPRTGERARVGRGRARAGAARPPATGPAARDAARRARTRRSPLALPLRLRLLRGALDATDARRRRPDRAGPAGRDLTPAVRALGAPGQGRGRPRARATATRRARSSSWRARWPPATPLAGHAGVPPGPDELRAARVPAGAERPRAAGRRAAAARPARRGADPAGRGRVPRGRSRHGRRPPSVACCTEFPDAPESAAGAAGRRLDVAAPGPDRRRPARVPRVRAARARPSRTRPTRSCSPPSWRSAAGDLDGGPRAARPDRADVPDAPAHRLRAAQPRHPAACAPATAAAAPTRAARLARARAVPARCSAARTPRSAPPLLGSGDAPGAQRGARAGPAARGSVRSRASASAPSRCAGAAGTTPRKASPRRATPARRTSPRPPSTGSPSIALPRRAAATSSKPAQAALAALPPGPRQRRPGRRAALRRSPAIAVDEKDWPGALGYRAAPRRPTTRRTRPPTTRSSASAAGAAAATAWPVALEADTLLRQRYPQQPVRRRGRGCAVAEALLETGKRGRGPARDRPGAGASAERPRRATLLLARAREAGRRP